MILVLSVAIRPVLVLSGAAFGGAQATVLWGDSLVCSILRAGLVNIAHRRVDRYLSSGLAPAGMDRNSCRQWSLQDQPSLSTLLPSWGAKAQWAEQLHG